MRFIIAFGKTISKAMSKHHTDPVCVQKIPSVFKKSFATKFLVPYLEYVVFSKGSKSDVDFISGVDEGFVLKMGDIRVVKNLANTKLMPNMMEPTQKPLYSTSEQAIEAMMSVDLEADQDTNMVIGNIYPLCAKPSVLEEKAAIELAIVLDL